MAPDRLTFRCLRAILACVQASSMERIAAVAGLDSVSRDLGLLTEGDSPMSLGVLSEETGLSLPAISRAVDGLVQRGAVKRAEDPNDRRAKLLTVTARGRGTYERLASVRAAGVRRFVEELEPQERDALGAVLHPIVERLSL